MELKTKCLDCGQYYHISSDVCPHCGLEKYWLEMADFFTREIARCEQKVRECKENARRAAAGVARLPGM